MILYRKKGLRFAEYWFGEEPQLAGADLVRCYNRDVPDPRGLSRPRHTILIDLRRPLDTLFQAIKKTARYEISRAATRDELVSERWNGRQEQALAAFCDYYAKFTEQRGLPGPDRRWLTYLSATGQVEVSRIEKKGIKDVLAWHAYFRSHGRAMLLHSASFFRDSLDRDRRSLVGRANRLLHWEDMSHFKADGAAIYDLGGWHAGTENQALLRINRFKEQFGGTLVKDFITEYPLTLKARLFLQVRRWLTNDSL